MTAAGKEIASRDYDVRGAPPLKVRIFQPRHDSSGQSWFCDFAIEGPFTQERSTAGGADSMQALLLAIYAVRTYLELSQEYVSGLLSLDGSPGFLDLPELQHHPRNPSIPPGYAGAPDR